MGQCAAKGALRGGKGEGGFGGSRCFQDDIREAAEEEEARIYAGRDLVLRETSRALRTIVATEAPRGRRSWGARHEEAWGRGALVVEGLSEEEGEEVYYPARVIYRRMDRVPAYRYGEEEEEEEGEEEEDGENPCDRDYQTQYRYCDQNNQFTVKEVVKKPGCETFEIDFGDGLLTSKRNLLRRGRRDVVGRGGAGRGVGRGGVGRGTMPGGGGRMRTITRIGSFKRSVRKVSVGGAPRTKDDIVEPGRRVVRGAGGARPGRPLGPTVPQPRGSRAPRGRGAQPTRARAKGSPSNVIGLRIRLQNHCVYI